MTNPMALMQITQAFQPQVDAPGQPVGTPNPMQVQSQQFAPQYGPNMLDQFQWQPPQPTGSLENPSLDPQLFQKNQELQNAAIEYQKAATPVMTGFGRLGVLEGLARKYTSRDERDEYLGKLSEAQKRQYEVQAESRVRMAKGTAQIVSGLMGPEKAQVIGDLVYNNPQLQEKVLTSFFTASNPSNLQKMIEYAESLPPGDAKDLAVQYIQKGNGGMQLSIDKDGKILFAAGGEKLPVQSSTRAAEEVQLQSAEDAMEELSYLKEDFQMEYLGAEGVVRGTVGSAADWLGLPFFNDEKEFAGQREAFIAQNRRFVDTYRRAVTGAQASQAELTRIEQRLMNAAENGPQEWMRKFNSIILEQNRKANRQRKKLGLPMLPEKGNLVFSEQEITGKDKEKVDPKTGVTLEDW